MLPHPNLLLVAGPRRPASPTRRRCQRLPCSASAAWLQGRGGQQLRPGELELGVQQQQQQQTQALQFLLVEDYDSDSESWQPGEAQAPLSPIAPTAPPLRRVLIRAHDRLRHLSVASRRLLAGGVSAAVSKTAVAPLETVKMQLVQGRMSAGQAAQRIWQDHGAAGFFRGNLVDVLRTVPSKSAELAMYESFKRGLRRLKTPEGRHLLPDSMVGGVAGGMAGLLSTCLVYPLETVRTRMAVAQGGPCYNSVLDCVVKMSQQEGAGALWKGLDASLVGVVPYSALRLGIYDALRWSYKQATDKHHIDAQAALVFGAVAGIASSTATFPFEVARRRMMVGAAYPNTFAAITTIAREEGVQALFAGVGLGLLKQGPQYALGFAAYEMAKQWLDL